MSGQQFANRGHSTALAACSPAVMRIVPDGVSRNALSAVSSVPISSKRGSTVRSNRSPASVGATLRVVRFSSRSPNRVSSPLIVWLSADCETPSWAAARVKLRAFATAKKARRSLTSRRSIDEPNS
jgi:hypothetical protein